MNLRGHKPSSHSKQALNGSRRNRFLHCMRRLLAKGQEILERFIRVFYPSFCSLCECPLELKETSLCAACLSRLSLLKPPTCIRCSTELPPFGDSVSLCRVCRRTKTFFRRGIAFFRYDETMKAVLQKIKFARKSWYLKPLIAQIPRSCLRTTLPNYDLLIPVPADPARHRKREFNQSLLIARLLCKRQQITAVVADVLKKTKASKAQSTLDRESRLVNLTGVFQVKRRANIIGKTVLLVDDVVTTGATVNACARCLMENGAKRVDFLALAHAVN